MEILKLQGIKDGLREFLKLITIKVCKFEIGPTKFFADNFRFSFLVEKTANRVSFYI